MFLKLWGERHRLPILQLRLLELGQPQSGINSNLSANITDAHDRGKIWMQPVSVQDARPSQAIYDEANNSENLRVTWNAAIKGADWVQIPTWNDYSENARDFTIHTHWMGSTQHQFLLSDPL
jgi:hypothetical protein